MTLRVPDEVAPMTSTIKSRVLKGVLQPEGEPLHINVTFTCGKVVGGAVVGAAVVGAAVVGGAVVVGVVVVVVVVGTVVVVVGTVVVVVGAVVGA